MYIVKYVENGVEKQSEMMGRDEAFLFQSGLFARRKMTENGTWNIEVKGVWRV